MKEKRKREREKRRETAYGRGGEGGFSAKPEASQLGAVAQSGLSVTAKAAPQATYSNDKLTFSLPLYSTLVPANTSHEITHRNTPHTACPSKFTPSTS